MPEFELELDPFHAEQAADFPTESVPRRSTNADDWRLELSAYLADMQKFEGMEPTEVFFRLAAFSARAAEIRFQIASGESRRLTAFRTQCVDPFIEMCEFQFRVHSRIQAIREMEFRISGGGM